MSFHQEGVLTHAIETAEAALAALSSLLTLCKAPKQLLQSLVCCCIREEECVKLKKEIKGPTSFQDMYDSVFDVQ